MRLTRSPLNQWGLGQPFSFWGTGGLQRPCPTFARVRTAAAQVKGISARVFTSCARAGGIPAQLLDNFTRVWCVSAKVSDAPAQVQGKAGRVSISTLQ